MMEILGDLTEWKEARFMKNWFRDGFFFSFFLFIPFIHSSIHPIIFLFLCFLYPFQAVFYDNFLLRKVSSSNQRILTLAVVCSVCSQEGLCCMGVGYLVGSLVRSLGKAWARIPLRYGCSHFQICRRPCWSQIKFSPSFRLFDLGATGRIFASVLWNLIDDFDDHIQVWLKSEVINRYSGTPLECNSLIMSFYVA
jgi:hypothetical protein